MYVFSGQILQLNFIEQLYPTDWDAIFAYMISLDDNAIETSNLRQSPVQSGGFYLGFKTTTN